MTNQTLSDEELRRPAASQLGVLGQPIAHSMSPAIHREAYRVLGLPWQYEPFDLPESGFEAFVMSKGAEWRGFSITMPLKEEAFRLAAVVDPVAAESEVVNTYLQLTSTPAGQPRWAGFNTDVAGLARAIARVELDATRTVVIGAGATAVSAILAARQLGAQEITVIARNAAAVSALVAKFDGSAEPGGTPITVFGTTFEAAESGELQDKFAEASLVISTIPGPAGKLASIPDTLVQAPLFDVAYDPWPSPLSERWEGAGGTAFAGLEMLVEQALIQVRIFMNGDPGVALEDEQAVLDAMRAASVER